MTRIAFRSTAIAAAAALALAACHKAPPPAPPPAPAPAPAPDNSAAEARARAAAQARADSIARAEAAARDAAAREAAARAAREAAARATIANAIYFDLDKDAIRPDAQQVLDAKIPVLKAQAALHIRIDGNADDRGSDEYNLALGQRRSAAAKRYLEAQGIDASRIDVVSFGKERGVCKEENESCWQQNRRDGFTITSGASGAGGGSNR